MSGQALQQIRCSSEHFDLEQINYEPIRMFSLPPSPLQYDLHIICGAHNFCGFHGIVMRAVIVICLVFVVCSQFCLRLCGCILCVVRAVSVICTLCVVYAIGVIGNCDLHIM